MNVRINSTIMRIEMARYRLTNNSLKELTGVSKNTISAIRNGKSCSYDTANKIAKALQIGVNELIESEG